MGSITESQIGDSLTYILSHYIGVSVSVAAIPKATWEGSF